MKEMQICYKQIMRNMWEPGYSFLSEKITIVVFKDSRRLLSRDGKMTKWIKVRVGVV
jgi:hypothetical protein